jgi:release factor glutamine methyltransferase
VTKLSPIADTENLIRVALPCLEGLSAPRILDLGTGSGAILITLLAEHNGAIGTGVDLSEAALEIARENAERHKVEPDWLCGSWYAPLPDQAQFDLIISNPPYITAAAMDDLEPEVRDYDPALALAGGVDGLTAYRDIIQGLDQYLAPNGWVVFEIGFDQAKSVTALMEAAGFDGVRCHQDMSGQDRVIIAQNPR